MKRIRIWGIGASVFAGALFIGTVVRSPITQAHGAAYSTPVTVLNTTANPAIASSMDNPGRIPYMSRQSLFLSSPATSASFNFPTVPANHRLVITQLSHNLTVNTSSATTLSVTLLNPSNLTSGEAWFYAPSTNSVSLFTTPVTWYFDAGQTPQVTGIPASSGVQLTGGQAVTLFGYMLDCSAAPCAALAQ